MSITYCGSVFVALSIQHEMRVRHVDIFRLPRSTIFSTLSHKRHGFRKEVTEHKTCVSNFSTNFVRKIFHSNKNCARYNKKMYIGLHVKYPLFLSDFNKT